MVVSDKAVAMVSAEQLETCEVCGREISPRAEVCPHCGDPKYRGRLHRGCLKSLFQLIVTLGILGIVVAVVYLALQKGFS